MKAIKIFNSKEQQVRSEPGQLYAVWLLSVESSGIDRVQWLYVECAAIGANTSSCVSFSPSVDDFYQERYMTAVLDSYNSASHIVRLG